MNFHLLTFYNYKLHLYYYIHTLFYHKHIYVCILLRHFINVSQYYIIRLNEYYTYSIYQVTHTHTHARTESKDRGTRVATRLTATTHKTERDVNNLEARDFARLEPGYRIIRDSAALAYTPA